MSFTFNPFTGTFDVTGSGGGGGGTPGGPDTAIQFNDSGSFGGSANLTFADGIVALIGPYTASQMSTDRIGPSVVTLNVDLSDGDPGDVGELNAIRALSYTTVAGSSNGSVEGIYSQAGHNVAGTLHFLAGLYTNTYVDTGTVTDLVGVWSETAEAYDGGHADNAYAYYALSPDGDGTGSITNNFGIWIGAQASTSAMPITNSYALWSDEQGVFRIKADNTFDSVYQAIPALYNPLFTKYTPGAADYERIQFHWNSNVAEFGTIAAGAGTLRALNLLGASVSANGVPIVTTTGSQALSNKTGNISQWTNDSGYLTSAGAVTSLTGTANRVTVSAATGAITLSGPQDIATGSTPQFARMGIGAAADSAHLLLITLGTLTTDVHGLHITGTWNSSGTTFDAPIFVNITNTASAAGSKLLDLQAGASSKFAVNASGDITIQGANAIQRTTAAGLTLTAVGNGTNGTWLSSGAAAGTVIIGSGADLLLSRAAAAVLQMGLDANGAAVSQTIQAANGITGTDKTGGNLTLASGKGTGAGAVSSLIFQTPTVLGSGTTAQSLATRLTLSSAGATFAAGITTIGGAVFHTTSSALTDGAGAGAGTLTNAPAAGNPTKWIGINDNGTTRYIPAW